MASSDEKTVKLAWEDATSIPQPFVDQLHIRVVQGNYYLTFGQLNLPVFDGEPPEDFVARIHPVARMVVPAPEMERMLEALRRINVSAKGG
ncbi:MAG: hypothetical protein AAB224_01300 [Gemmatimonadota bacterium]